ncbi:MAG: geranylgeranyl reductase family protein [Candidatus Norongarragalinales archaeon]
MICLTLESSYDAVVIGAGPAGSAFAKKCAKEGMSVLVIEKKKEIGSPVRCGEGIAEHTEDELGIKLKPQAIGSPIDGAALYSPNHKKLVFKTPATQGYVLERKIFDKHLAIEAGRAGAHFLPHTLVDSVIEKNGKPGGVKVTHMGEQMEFHASLVVSAEGMEARIARQLGFDAKASLYDVDTCFEYEMVNVECERLIELFFSNRLAPRGYVWVFPKGSDVANVGIGIGGSSGANPKALLDQFISENKQRFGKAEPVEFKGGVISVGAPLDHLVADNAMVVGTAAHQVDPIHGGGIGLAIQAGSFAADAAIAAFRKSDFSRKQLASYEKEFNEKVAPKLAKRLKLRKVMEKLSDDDWNHIFNELSPEDVQKILDGEFKPVAAKVVLKRPTLLKVLTALM